MDRDLAVTVSKFQKNAERFQAAEQREFKIGDIRCLFRNRTVSMWSHRFETAAVVMQQWRGSSVDGKF